MQLAVYRALGGPLSGVFREEDVTAVRASLQRGKSGSVLVLTFLLAEGRNPEKVFERALDQLFKLWRASGDRVLSGRQNYYAASTAAWLQQGKASSIVGFAARFESLLERTLALAESAHLTGDPLGPVRDIELTANVPSAELSAFVATWLNRGRARVVFVEPDGSTNLQDATPPVFAAVSNLKLSVPEEMFKKRIAGPRTDLRTFTLKSGLEAVLARRATGPILAVTLAAKGGESDAEPLGAANMAQYAEIEEAWHGIPWNIGASRAWWTESSTSYLQFRAASGNLDDALGMLRDAVNSMHVDSVTDAAFDFSVKDRAQKAYDLPRNKAERDLVEHIHTGTPLGRTPSPSQYGRVSPGQANGWLEQTWNPANSVLTVTGDIEMGPAEGAVRRLMEDWAPRSNRTPLSLLLASRAPETPVPVLTTPRPGARQTVATFGCAVPVRSAEDLAALHVLGERIAMRLHQTSRVVLGATYGFSHSEDVKRGIGELRVSGALEERGLTRVLALLRREAATLGTQTLSRDDLDRVRWREGIKSNARMQHATDLGLALADLRLSGLPTETFEHYPAVLQKLGPEDVTRLAGACRKNVVINLWGTSDGGEGGAGDGVVTSDAYPHLRRDGLCRDQLHTSRLTERGIARFPVLVPLGRDEPLEIFIE